MAEYLANNVDLRRIVQSCIDRWRAGTGVHAFRWGLVCWGFQSIELTDADIVYLGLCLTSQESIRVEHNGRLAVSSIWDLTTCSQQAKR